MLAALQPYLPLAVGVIVAGAVLYARNRVPAELVVLMITAFIDMAGLLMVLPLLPFYAKRLGAGGFVVGALVAAFSVAQLLSAPLWGRFSDRWGRRPALLVALTASTIAYVVFGFATSLVVLFLSRIVQGAGGGTVGVIQAYVADATKPEDRAANLGWLSAATNLGVFLGPVLGSFAVSLEGHGVDVGWTTVRLGHATPGLLAAALCAVNILFAWRFLRESHSASGRHVAAPGTSRGAVWRVVAHSGEPASRLIWIYAIAIGAQQGTTAVLALFLAERFQVDEKSIGFFFMYIGAISVLSRAVLLGWVVTRLGEARLSRIGTALMAIGLGTMPLSRSLWMLAASVALIPLGAAFTFPCVTALLSRVISNRERGLYMGVQQTFGGLARVVFPLVLGLAYDHLGHGVPFWISATLVAATIFLGLGMEGYERDARTPKAVVAD